MGISDRKRTEDLGLLLFESSGKLRRRQDQVLKSTGQPLTYRQYRTLYRIDEGYTSVTAIARIATIGLPSISAAVASLVDRGLVERVPRENDNRSHELVVTRKGYSALETGHRRLQDLAQEILGRDEFNDCESPELDVVASFVESLVRALQQMALEDRREID